MKIFRFKFKRLQKIRERAENAALLRLSLAQKDLGREEKLLADLVDAVESSGAQLLTLLKDGAPGAMLRNADTFRLSTSAAATKQREVAHRAAEKVAETREKFRRAHQEAEAIRMLHDKGRKAHRKESLRQMQKELDEIGTGSTKTTAFAPKAAAGRRKRRTT